MQDYDVSVSSGAGPNNQFLKKFFLLSPFGQRIGAFIMAVVLPGLFGPGIFLWTPGQIPSQDNTIVSAFICFEASSNIRASVRAIISCQRLPRSILG